MANPLTNFTAPIPGSSLTKEFGSMPHQKPPEIVDPNEAKERIWKELNRKPILQSVWHLAETGMPAMNIAMMIIYKACMNSMFTIDVAVLILPTVMNMIEVICYERGIKIELRSKIKTATDAMFESDALRELSAAKPATKAEELPVETAEETAPVAPTGLMGNVMNKTGEA